jgi:hypothetical protein
MNKQRVDSLWSLVKNRLGGILEDIEHVLQDLRAGEEKQWRLLIGDEVHHLKPPEVIYVIISELAAASRNLGDTYRCVTGKEPRWNPNWPKRPGWYWFHGKCGHADGTRTHLVRVRRSSNGKLIYVCGEALFLYEEEGAEGVWQFTTLPQPPYESDS